MNARNVMTLASVLLAAFAGCADGKDAEQAIDNADLGAVTLGLTNAPSDAKCLRVQMDGVNRSLTRLLPLKQGGSSLFRLEGLPVGRTHFSADTFNAACEAVFPNSVRTWYSEPVTAQIAVVQVANVVLEMIRNGRGQLAVDFDESNGPKSDALTELLPGTTSSQASYLVPSAPGVKVRAILTVGDAAALKPDGTPYRMVGIPDGLGGFDNGDGTFTLLSNHELGQDNGIARAHGGTGAFVSRWRVRSSDLAVLSGEDLIQSHALWNAALGAYNAPNQGNRFGRFCSADLADSGAYYDAVTGLGTEARFFLNGEEIGAEGRAFAHGLDGVSYELPRLGKYSFENAVAAPATGERTVVVGTDDEGNGQIYIYAGNKTNTGTDIERAGLTNGSLFVVAVPGYASESNADGIPATRFEAAELGNVENWTGAALQRASVAIGATGFQRPEDGAWDPVNPNDFYFVTTASAATNSRLFRLRFEDAANPELGGTIEAVLDGSEGHRMLDNITIDRRGHILMTEDIGGNAHLGRVYRYDIATDTLTVIATHDPERFAPGAANFLTSDEEATGIIDASDYLGEGWFVLASQAHFGISGELVQGGQFMALFDPGSL